MGTPANLNAIMGRIDKIDLSDLPSEDLVRLLRWAVAIAASEDRIMPGSRPLSRWVTGKREGVWYQTNADVLQLPATNLTTKSPSMLHLARIGGSYANPSPSTTGHLKPVDSRDELMLARPDVLVRWIAQYKVSPGLLVATSSRFYPPGEAELLDLADTQPYTVREALNSILESLRDSYARQIIAAQGTASRVSRLNHALLVIK